MKGLGNGLYAAKRYVEALSVGEAELSTMRRIGAPEAALLIAQGNLAGTYRSLGRIEEALPMKRDAYTGYLKLYGEENRETLREAGNYASLLTQLKRFEEAKAVLRRTVPVARRVLGDGHDTTLRARWHFGQALYKDDRATLDDLHEAVNTMEDTVRTARRVLGSDYPIVSIMENGLDEARAARRTREAQA